MNQFPRNFPKMSKRNVKSLKTVYTSLNLLVVLVVIRICPTDRLFNFRQLDKLIPGGPTGPVAPFVPFVPGGP